MVGDFEKALEYEERRLPIVAELDGKCSINYATALVNISGLYTMNDRKPNAERSLQQALEILKNNYGEENPIYYYAWCEYDNLRNDNTNSVATKNQRISMAKKVFGEHSKEYADALIYSVDFSLNPSDQDIATVEKGIEIKRKGGYDADDEFLIQLSFLSTHYSFGKKWQKLIISTNECQELLRKRIRENFIHLTDRQREGYWNAHLSSIIQDNVLYAIRYNQYAFENDDYTLCNEFSEIAYNSCLLAKGLLLASTTNTNELISTSGDSLTVSLREKLYNVNRQLSQFQPHSEVYKQNMATKDKIQRELLQRMNQIGNFMDFTALTWKDVQQHLKEGEVAIEFCSYPVQQTVQYAAVFIGSTGIPLATCLFLEEELKNLQDSETGYNYLNPRLYNVLWQTLEVFTEIKNAHTIYFTPDGLLNNINIECTIDSNGILARDKRQIYRLSSTRELCGMYQPERELKAVAFGGMLYSAAYQSVLTGTRVSKFNLSHNLFRGVSKRSKFSDLKHTREEAANIVEQIKKREDSEATLFAGEDALEESFKSLSGKSFKILHLATHGFYYDEDQLADFDVLGTTPQFVASALTSANFMEDRYLTQSGLAFSGANNILSGNPPPSGIDDGILTAYEIAELDLSNVDLAVLSACETGLGKINREGVFGLQRGFKKAGLKSLLMSLWEVPDKATAILMKEFYSNYINGLSLRESLIKAQNFLKEDPEYANPVNWAGWILLDALN